jgi:hypothetical protein
MRKVEGREGYQVDRPRACSAKLETLTTLYSGCLVCGEQLDPVLIVAGDTSHPCCDPGETLICGTRGCKDTAVMYPHGTWCLQHARMMAPRSQWEQLGVPYPEGKEPPPRPPMPVLTQPIQARLGGLDVVYAPCPNGCGRPTCYLPGQIQPPCLGCESAR